jgi:hypothetical protein
MLMAFTGKPAAGRMLWYAFEKAVNDHHYIYTIDNAQQKKYLPKKEKQMTDTEKTKLEQRGRMAYLKDDITRLSRERDTLLRPLRERITRALPLDEPPQEAAKQLDCDAAAGELVSVAAVNCQLDAAINEYDDLATILSLPKIKRNSY